LLALDRDNLAVLKRLRPVDATAELALLMDSVAGREGSDVADPYYGGEAGFETTWRDVSAAAKALVARLSA
jgi:protein-tyrosine phosphatase